MGIFMFENEFIDKQEIVEWNFSDVINTFKRFIVLVQSLGPVENLNILVMLWTCVMEYVTKKKLI